MPTFRGMVLTKDTEFFVLAQFAIEKFSLIPYGAQPLTDDISADNIQQLRARGMVYRKFHGGLHAASTAINVQLLLDLYHRFTPELLCNPNGTLLVEDDVKLVKLAAIYHDSANINENQGDPAQHAKNFRDDMLKLGFDQQKIKWVADAVINKDSKKITSIYQRLIHDADCLDVIRVVWGKFDDKHLCILRDIPGFSFTVKLKRIIANHQETLKLFYHVKNDVSDLHRECEFSDFCYSELLTIYRRLLFNNILSLAASKGKVLMPQMIDTSRFSLIDLFDRNGCTRTSQVISKAKDVMDIVRSRRAVVKIINNGYAEFDNPADILEDERWEYLVDEIKNPNLRREASRQQLIGCDKQVFNFFSNRFERKFASTAVNSGNTLKTSFSLLPAHGKMLLAVCGVGILCNIDQTKVSPYIFKTNASTYREWWRNIYDGFGNIVAINKKSNRQFSVEDVGKLKQRYGYMSSVEELRAEIVLQEAFGMPLKHNELMLGINKNSIKAVVIHLRKDVAVELAEIMLLKLKAISRYHYLKESLGLDLPIIVIEPNEGISLYSLQEQKADIEVLLRSKYFRLRVLEFINVKKATKVDLDCFHKKLLMFSEHYRSVVSQSDVMLICGVVLDDGGRFSVEFNACAAVEVFVERLQQRYGFSPAYKKDKLFVMLDLIDCKIVCEQNNRFDFPCNMLLADAKVVEYWEKYFFNLFSKVLTETTQVCAYSACESTDGFVVDSSVLPKLSFAN